MARASTSIRASSMYSSSAWTKSLRYTRSTKTREGRMLSRREALIRIGSAAGVAALTPRRAAAQGAAKPEPPSVVSNPPRDFASPVTYPDPDIITHDPSFNAIRLGNTPIQRLWTGGMWCEGPAWNGQGQYLIWSDIPNNRQMRWIEDDAR